MKNSPLSRKKAEGMIEKSIGLKGAIVAPLKKLTPLDTDKAKKKAPARKKAK